jgi:hypothetical protein
MPCLVQQVVHVTRASRRGYFGFELGDPSLRAEFYKMRDREEKEAKQRAEIERDELAKLGASRKK